MPLKTKEVKIVNESENPLPKYKTKGAAGADLYANEEAIIPPGKMKKICSGIKVAIPDGFELQVRSRSGLAHDNQVFVLNSPGTIDEDYRGLVGVLLFNAGEEDFEVKKGDRIAQAVLCPVYQAAYMEVDTLDKTDRGEGGFGHTGKN